MMDIDKGMSALRGQLTKRPILAIWRKLQEEEKRQKEIRGSSLRSSSMRYPVSVS